ncbi:MAG: PQQ-binding-like beta-propeller repeat protein, partial [Xanthobacteraceae bacterium]
GRYQNPEKRRDPINWGPPTLAGGRLLIANSISRMVEVDPVTGEKIGETKLPASTTLAPALAGGVLYLLTDDGDVVAMRGSTPGA